MLRVRLLTLAAIAAARVVSAQTDQGQPLVAPILRTERAGSGVIRIVYDLRAVSGSLFTISLEASSDGGQTFSIQPRAVTGDVGPSVSPGGVKTIAWDTTKDVEDLQIDRYVFRVIVSPGGTTASAPPATSAAPTPPGGSGAAPGATPGRAGATASAPKSGGLSKGAILGIAGGAAAAGVGIAVSKGKRAPGTTPTPSPSTPSTQQTRSFTGPYSVPLSVVVTNPDGTGPCTHAVVFAGNLTLTLDVIAGSVTGSATFQGTMTLGATTCNNRGVPTPTPGTSSNTSIGNIPVTGTPGSLSFTRQAVSQGANPDGVPIFLTLTFSFTGVLSSDTVSGSLTISYRDESGEGASARIGLATGTIVVTLR